MLDSHAWQGCTVTVLYTRATDRRLQNKEMPASPEYRYICDTNIKSCSRTKKYLWMVCAYDWRLQYKGHDSHEFGGWSMCVRLKATEQTSTWLTWIRGMVCNKDWRQQNKQVHDSHEFGGWSVTQTEGNRTNKCQDSYECCGWSVRKTDWKLQNKEVRDSRECCGRTACVRGRRRHPEEHGRWRWGCQWVAVASQTPLWTVAWTGSCQTEPACPDTENAEQYFIHQCVLTLKMQNTSYTSVSWHWKCSVILHTPVCPDTEKAILHAIRCPDTNHTNNIILHTPVCSDTDNTTYFIH